MRIKDRAVLFFATGGFIGTIPLAPGTFGSLWGIPLCYGLSTVGVVPAAFLALLFVLAAVWIAGAAEKILGDKDPGAIVIDEVAGFAVALLGLPFDVLTVISGFLLFRLLDIVKPFPAGALEKRLPGGSGVVLDDVMAGIYSNLLLRGLLFVFMNWR